MGNGKGFSPGKGITYKTDLVSIQRNDYSVKFIGAGLVPGRALVKQSQMVRLQMSSRGSKILQWLVRSSTGENRQPARG